MCTRLKNPLRVTELLHWRTLGEIFNYVNLRGCISSEATSMKPLRFVDCYCNLYKTYHFGGMASIPGHCGVWVGWTELSAQAAAVSQGH